MLYNCVGVGERKVKDIETLYIRMLYLVGFFVGEFIVGPSILHL